jgi:hypothetical protein
MQLEQFLVNSVETLILLAFRRFVKRGFWYACVGDWVRVPLFLGCAIPMGFLFFMFLHELVRKSA